MCILGKIEKFWLMVLFPLLLAAALGVYLRYAQQSVGACDWYGYYEEAQLMKQGTVFLKTEIPHQQFPAIVPFGFHSAGDRIVPQYPPGYPLILAFFGLAKLEYYAGPFLGLLSCLLLFLTMKGEGIKAWIAALFTVAWAFNPIVVYGATSVMSDLSAAVCVLAAYYTYRRGWLMASALCLGFGVAVRPSNILFVLAFLPLLASDGKLFAYAWRLAIPGLLYAVYNGMVYGAPWRTGYADISYDLVPSVFWSRALFYVEMTSKQLTPTLLIFACLAWLKRSIQLLFWLSGFALLFVFYSFWRSGGDAWWWTRFLLPAYPALYLFAALGFGVLLERLQKLQLQLATSTVSVVLVAIAAYLPFRHIDYGIKRQDLWIENKGAEYRDLSMQAASLVPMGTYLGSVEFAGSMRLYTPEVIPFTTVRAGSFELVQHLRAQGKSVAILVEPWNKDHESIRRMLATYHSTLIKEFQLWNGIRLYLLQ